MLFKEAISINENNLNAIGQNSFMPKPKIAAILLMGGLSTRFKSSFPKQLHKIGGKPIFIHTLERFLQMNEITQVILPAPKKWKFEVEKELLTLQKKNKIQVICGGESRQQSSFLGLLACNPDTDYVIIHDAVRPFVSLEILRKNLEEVLLHKAIDTCIPSTDTLIRSSKNTWIQDIPPREQFLRGQTPQTFSFPLIVKAHKKALEEGVENSSDDCQLVLRLPHQVKIVEGSELNIKITTELDLFLAERLLSRSIEEFPAFLDSTVSNLKGKIFAVTGGTGDIGKALCKRLLELEAIPIAISTSAESFTADLTNHAETKAIFKAIHAKYGPLDGIINSIGTFSVKDFASLSQEEMEKTIASNLTSVIYCCQCIQLKKGGHIINVSSSSYSKGRKDYPIYSASKAAVVNFTQGLAEAMPDLFINVIVPERTNSTLRRANFPEEDTKLLLDPQEIADKIAKLLNSSNFTGTIIEVRKRHN